MIMVATSRKLGQRLSSLKNRLAFRHLLTVTLGLVAGTILLGVAAKATGSGLACEASWPQCDGGPFNLLPASLPSFYEWIHRFVAMFAGFGIIASGVTAWLSSSVDRRVAPLVVLGTLLTPVQVYLGRETVLQYKMDILSLHFWTAILIFSLFTVATVLVWKEWLTERHAAVALVVALVALPLHVLMSPTQLGVVTEYTPTVQLLQYGVTLALLASVFLATMVTRWEFKGSLPVALLLGSAVLSLVVAYLGRRAVMTFSPTLDQLYLGAVVVLGIALIGGIRMSLENHARQRHAG